MIYLSATGIKDFLACSQKYYWRMSSAEESETSDDMLVGNVFHKLMQTSALATDFEKQAFEQAKVITEQKAYQKFFFCVDEWCNGNLKETLNLSPDDEVEKYFRIKIDEDVAITGKIDRITKDGVVIDWKTARKTPSNINNDIQFLLYRWAFHKIYGKYPAKVLYVSSFDGSIIPLKVTNSYQYMLDVLIPGVIRQVKAGNFYKSGLYTGECYMCSYKSFCLGGNSELSG